MFFETIDKLDHPVTIRGALHDCSVQSPHNSIFTNDRDEYTVTLELEDGYLLDEIKRVFRIESAHAHFPHVSTWESPKSQSIRAASIIQPKVAKDGKEVHEELKPGTVVDLRCKLVLNQMDETIVEAIQIVYINVPDLDAELEASFDEVSEVEQRLGSLDF